MNDRIIKFQQLDEIGLQNTRESWYNQFRGELVLVEGFKKTTTKNGIIKTDDFNKILGDIRKFLMSATDNEYKRNLFKNGYTSRGEGRELFNEYELQDIIHKRLTSPISNYKKVEKEYKIEKLGVSVDFLVDGTPWEIKNKKLTTHDVSQLLTYIITLDAKCGTLICTDYSENVVFLVDLIKERFDIAITLNKSEEYI